MPCSSHFVITILVYFEFRDGFVLTFNLCAIRQILVKSLPLSLTFYRFQAGPFHKARRLNSLLG